MPPHTAKTTSATSPPRITTVFLLATIVVIIAASLTSAAAPTFYLPPFTSAGYQMNFDRYMRAFIAENSSFPLLGICSTGIDAKDAMAWCRSGGYLWNLTTINSAYYTGQSETKSPFFMNCPNGNEDSLAQCTRTATSGTCNSFSYIIQVLCSGYISSSWELQLEPTTLLLQVRPNSTAPWGHIAPSSISPTDFHKACALTCAAAGLPYAAGEVVVNGAGFDSAAECYSTSNPLPASVPDPGPLYVTSFGCTNASDKLSCSGNTATNRAMCDASGSVGMRGFARCRGRFPSAFEYQVDPATHYVLMRANPTASWEPVCNGDITFSEASDAYPTTSIVSDLSAQKLCKWAGKDWTGATAYNGPKSGIPTGAGIALPTDDLALINGFNCGDIGTPITKLSECMAFKTRQKCGQNQWLKVDCVNATWSFSESALGALVAKQSANARWKNVHAYSSSLWVYYAGPAICRALGRPTQVVLAYSPTGTIDYDQTYILPGNPVVAFGSFDSATCNVNSTDFNADCGSAVQMLADSVSYAKIGIYCGYSNATYPSVPIGQFNYDPRTEALLYRTSRLTSYNTVCATNAASQLTMTLNSAQYACSNMGRPWRGARWFPSYGYPVQRFTSFGAGPRMALENIQCSPQMVNATPAEVAATATSFLSNCTYNVPTTCTYGVGIECAETFPWEWRVNWDNYEVLEMRRAGETEWKAVCSQNIGPAVDLCRALGLPTTSTFTSGSSWLAPNGGPYNITARYLSCPPSNNGTGLQGCSFVSMDRELTCAAPFGYPTRLRCWDPATLQWNVDDVTGEVRVRPASSASWMPFAMEYTTPLTNNATTAAICRWAGKPSTSVSMTIGPALASSPPYLVFKTAATCVAGAMNLTGCPNYAPFSYSVVKFPKVYISCSAGGAAPPPTTTTTTTTPSTSAGAASSTTASASTTTGGGGSSSTTTTEAATTTTGAGGSTPAAPTTTTAASTAPMTTTSGPGGSTPAAPTTAAATTGAATTTTSALAATSTTTTAAATSPATPPPASPSTTASPAAASTTTAKPAVTTTTTPGGNGGGAAAGTDDGPSATVIGASVGGVVVLVFLLAIGIYCVIRMRAKRDEQHLATAQNAVIEMIPNNQFVNGNQYARQDELVL